MYYYFSFLAGQKKTKKPGAMSQRSKTTLFSLLCLLQGEGEGMGGEGRGTSKPYLFACRQQQALGYVYCLAASQSVTEQGERVGTLLVF